MNKQNNELLRKIPSVDSLLQLPELKDLADGAGRKVVADCVRRAVEDLREQIVDGKYVRIDEDSLVGAIVSEANNSVKALMNAYYRRVINATGIVLHTGLGRAVLCKEAIEQIANEMGGYSVLQIGIESGKRSKRDVRVEQLLCMLTGAEAATVVNNNAAATAIVLNTIANGREVIVSRGQLVEIGGSFRLPEVMAFSGAKLVEVGATNKTHARDYENAITDDTAAILRVHPSNYKIEGFSSEVGLDELVEIAHSHGLVMIDDVGAGALVDLSKFGFEPEPMLADSITAGADIVTASGDKLIGASQSGIILGKSECVDAIRKNQFARIVRSGKLTLAALEATLKLFLDEAVALAKVPAMRMLLAKPKQLAKDAKRITRKLRKSVCAASIKKCDGFSQTGSGSLPGQNLATTLVVIRPEQMSAEALAKRLRGYSTPIFARIHANEVLIDPRTFCDGDEKILVKAVAAILGGGD